MTAMIHHGLTKLIDGYLPGWETNDCAFVIVWNMKAPEREAGLLEFPLVFQGIAGYNYQGGEWGLL